MTEEQSEPKKNRDWRRIGLAATGVVACVVGIIAGRAFTRSPESTVEPNTSALNESTQPEQVDPFQDGEENITPPVTEEIAEGDMADSSQTDSVSPAAVFGQPVESPVSNDLVSRQNHLELADERLRSGQYTQAVREYAGLIEDAQGAEEAALRFRLALAAESLSRYQEARSQYEVIIAAFPQLPWAEAARIGEVRCMAATGSVEGLAERVLRDVLVDETLHTRDVRGEIMHIAGRAMCESLLETSPQEALKRSVLVMPIWMTDPDYQLTHIPEVIDRKTLKSPPDGFKVMQQTDLLPESIYVRADTGPSNLKLLIEAVCRRSGCSCEISEMAEEAITQRTQQVHVADVPLSLLLDGLCAPFGLVWWHDADGVHVRASREVAAEVISTYRRGLADRLLTTALVMTPDSIHAGHSRLAQGILQYEQGAIIDAAYSFQLQLELDPRSDVSAEASLNLAKCRLETGERQAAEEALLVAVDSQSPHVEARIAAYLYYARIQLEEGDTSQAIHSLFRIMELSRGTDFEAEPALMLAAAYLLKGSPQGASSVLMEHRERLDRKPFHDVAAFASAYARFRAALLPAPKARAARALVTALSNFDAKQQFGAHWSYLRAEACEELGLTAQAIAAFRDTVRLLPAAPMRGRAMLKLAGHYRFEGKLDEASELLEAVSGERREEFGEQIAMQAAMVALKRGSPKVAINHCRYIVQSADDDALRRAALRTMGQAYESLHDHKSAVYCFAGMMPDRPPAVPGKSDRESDRKPAGKEIKPVTSISRAIPIGTRAGGRR